MLRRIHQLVVSYGPAIFIIGALIGTGSVTSMVRAGADHGMSLLWALGLSCLFFWVMIESISRLTLATGRTFVGLVRERLGRAAAIYVVIAIVVGQFTSNVGLLAIVADAFASWTGLNIVAVAAVVCSLTYAFMVFGTYTLFERAMMLLVTAFGLSFIINVFLVHPTPQQVVAGLIPRPPADPTELKRWALLVGGMVGTTLAGSVVVMRSYVITDKGWNLTHLPHARKDARVTGIMVFIISGVVMACAAGTFFIDQSRAGTGSQLRAIDMAYALEPLLGPWAGTLFVLGIVAAGLSSGMPNALVSIWSITDYFNWSRDPRTWRFRLMALPFCASGLIVPIFFQGENPVQVQLLSLAFQGAVMPVLVLFILLLLSGNAAGVHRNRTTGNVLIVLTLIFTCYTGYRAATGVINGLHEMFAAPPATTTQ